MHCMLLRQLGEFNEEYEEWKHEDELAKGRGAMEISASFINHKIIDDLGIATTPNGSIYKWRGRHPVSV